MPRKSFFGVLFMLIAGTVAATLGQHDPDISLAAVRTLWSDVLRDTDQVGMKITRMSDAREMQVGREVAAHVPGVDPMGGAVSLYLNDVGAELVKRVQRPGIAYAFHEVETPAINAFALPGGQIYVTSGMMGFLESEAELAAVLGHEISHVDLRHCIERYQYQEMLRRAGADDVGWMVETAHSLIAFNFTQDQERDADAAGLRLAMEAGYRPEAASLLFTRMSAQAGEVQAPAPTSPDGELRRAAGSAFESYFRTHPTSLERAKRLADLAAKDRRSLGSRQYYEGKENFRMKIARSKQTMRD